MGEGWGLRCEYVTGQGGEQLTQNQKRGGGVFFAESFRNQREGRWLVLGGI